MADATYLTLPTKTERITAPAGSDLRQLEIQHNNVVAYLQNLALCIASDGVLSGSTLAIGTTVTLATGACVITILGVTASVGAQTAQAFGALGTIPASTWGIIGVDAVAAGTITFVSGAANYTTGYGSEAAAIAAAPAKTSVKARLGYVTVLASASGWIAGTDALAGGTGGNPATTTNYYKIQGLLDLVDPSANQITLGSLGFKPKQIATLSGTVLTSNNY